MCFYATKSLIRSGEIEGMSYEKRDKQPDSFAQNAIKGSVLGVFGLIGVFVCSINGIHALLKALAPLPHVFGL